MDPHWSAKLKGISFHQFSKQFQSEGILELMKRGDTVLLVSAKYGGVAARAEERLSVGRRGGSRKADKRNGRRNRGAAGRPRSRSPVAEPYLPPPPPVSGRSQDRWMGNQGNEGGDRWVLS